MFSCSLEAYQDDDIASVQGIKQVAATHELSPSVISDCATNNHIFLIHKKRS